MAIYNPVTAWLSKVLWLSWLSKIMWLSWLAKTLWLSWLAKILWLPWLAKILWLSWLAKLLWLSWLTKILKLSWLTKILWLSWLAKILQLSWLTKILKLSSLTNYPATAMIDFLTDMQCVTRKPWTRGKCWGGGIISPAAQVSWSLHRRTRTRIDGAVFGRWQNPWTTGHHCELLWSAWLRRPI